MLETWINQIEILNSGSQFQRPFHTRMVLRHDNSRYPVSALSYSCTHIIS